MEQRLMAFGSRIHFCSLSDIGTGGNYPSAMARVDPARGEAWSRPFSDRRARLRFRFLTNQLPERFDMLALG
jgi:hypothetical protein